MTDAKIDILDLCDALGGMYNAVEFLISMKGYVTTINSWGHEEKDPKIQYRNNRMVDGITFGNSSYSYGYLKNNPDKIKIIFRGADPDMFLDLSTMKEKLDKKKDEVKLKHRDHDPYDEENWLEESKIFEYNKDHYEYVSPMGLFRKSYDQNKSDYDKFEYYMKAYLVGHEIEFKGIKVEYFDCHPFTRNNFNFIILRIKVNDVHITKNGVKNSAIYLMDDKGDYYFCTCDDIKIIDSEKMKKERENARLKHIEYDPYNEENWLEEKIITKFKMFEDLINNDPYDEENWDEEYKVGDKLICQIDYSIIAGLTTTHRYKKGTEYEIIDMDDKKMLLMSDTGKSHWFMKTDDNFKKTQPPVKRIYVAVRRNV